MAKSVPTLEAVLVELQQIAPLELAAEWDNVGLLIDPLRRSQKRKVERVLLTIDLTDSVVTEAAKARTDLIVAYHPAIFQPLTALRHDDGKQRAVIAAVAAGCAVYSPHTALDAAPSGIADWLADGVLDGDEPKYRRACGEGDYGRALELQRAIPFAKLVQRVKRHLGRKHLQIARPAGAKSPIRSIAVAAGAGASVLRGERVDVLVTGEMSHHEALATVARGTSVVLAGHSNTERGYLRILRRRLRKQLGAAVDVRVAKTDRDPFAIG